MKYLIFDISNLLYRTFFVQRQEDDETLAGLATHSALTMLNKYYKQFKPDQIVMAFDSSSWRKEYTASDACISKQPYKGHRRKDMTPSQRAKYERFINHLKEFEAMISNHTTVITLKADQLEADDLIAGFIQIHADEDNHIILISTDTDFLQLKKHPNVDIISPATGKAADLSEWNGDAEYYLFCKCVKGDKQTDNVWPALPNVRKTRLEKAYNDPYERVQLMQERWKDPHGREFLVEELFRENQLLIDLEKQPNDIRRKIYETVVEAVERDRQFSLFFIMKFVGKYKLNKIKENIDQYLPMLSKRIN